MSLDKGNKTEERILLILIINHLNLHLLDGALTSLFLSLHRRCQVVLVSVDGLVLDIHHLVTLGLLTSEGGSDDLLHVQRSSPDLTRVLGGLGSVGLIKQGSFQGFRLRSKR